MPFRRGGGFRKFGPRVDIPKPVKVGEEYDVEINEVGSRGDGIARIKNFVVFIGGAKQGEKTRIKITEVRNRFAIGEKVSGKAEAEVSEEEPVETEEVEEAEEPEEEE
jgi:predicted RNA-binding protein with TRAM domain